MHVSVQVTFKMHTHLIVCSTLNYIGFMGWPHPQPAPAQYFARWSVCVESIVNNVCECGCSILSSAPKNEMLSNWPLIVFVFSLRDLGHPEPLLLPVAHTRTHSKRIECDLTALDIYALASKCCCCCGSYSAPSPFAIRH